MTQGKSEFSDAIRAWRQWRQAQAAYNRAADKLIDWTPAIGDKFEAAQRAKKDAWKLACRLLDAASLDMAQHGDKPDGE